MSEADTESARVLAECRTLPRRDGLDRIIRATLEFLRESQEYRARLRTMRLPRSSRRSPRRPTSASRT